MRCYNVDGNVAVLSLWVCAVVALDFCHLVLFYNIDEDDIGFNIMLFLILYSMQLHFN